MYELVLYYPEGHEAHFEPGHPERPDRIEVIREALREAGWWEPFPILPQSPLPEEVLTAIHTPNYLSSLESASRRGAHLDADTYTTTASWDLAKNTAGGAIAVAEAVWQGESRRGLALTRPPGHHATPGRGMGFCLLNNIALAAEYLLQPAYGLHNPAKRLAIIDIDLHHGNGTQDIFWQRDDVFYISTHQSPLYPGTGSLTEIGSGQGAGFTANVPFPPGTGDRGFHAAMEEFILPLLDRFTPEILLLSVGFDPHWRDPLGHLSLSTDGYGRTISSLVAWADENCDGRIALFLEGGYDLDAGADCLCAAVAALLNLPWKDQLGSPPRPEGNSWQPILREAKRIWNLE